MRKLPILLLALPGLTTVAQETPHTLLWRITSVETTSPSYLFGTVHSKDDRAFQFADSVLPALDRCAIVAGELDIEKSKMGATALMTAMLLPDGQQLEDLYRKKDWPIVRDALAQQLGPMAAMAYRVKPFFVMAMLTESMMTGDRSMVLDEYLQKQAKERGKRVIGIETLQEQLGAVDALPVKEQAEMLLEQVKKGGHQAELDELMDAYAAYDLDRLQDLTDKSESMPKSMQDALLTERNTRMVQRLDSIIHTGENCFFLVGAAHLLGDPGLITGMRNRGYTVEPVMSAARKPEPVEMDR